MAARLMKWIPALLAGLAIASGVGPAVAADSALMVPIGYSQNLRYFAFEEFGIQDGSGFAYSSIYVIDIAQDHWVVGTPIRVVAESEDASLSAIRTQAYEDAKARLDDLAVDVPAHELASNGDGEPGITGKELVFGLPTPNQPDITEGLNTLELERYPTTAGSPCADWFNDEPVGFVLKLTDYGPTREIHRDGVLPRSRGCPTDYRIYSVYAPFGATDISHALAIISVYAHGFEGIDRRFIAVALAKSQVGF